MPLDCGVKAKNVRAHILWCLGPNKRLCHLDRHPLLGLGPPERSVPGSAVTSQPRHFLLLNVAPHAEHLDAVHPLHVVTHVELVEVEGHIERSISGRKEGGADEGDGEFGPGC